MKSYNVLCIESFSMMPDDRFNFGDLPKMIPPAEYELRCKLKINHPQYGQQGQFIISLRSREYSEADGLRVCLQSLLNKDFGSVDLQINSTSFEHCDVDRQNVHAVDYSHFEDPYKKIFDQVFTAANWKIQQSIEA